MSWNGSGVFVRLMNWVNDKNAAINITASRFDTDSNDFVTGLNNCLTRDGQGIATANLPMGAFKHTGVANGSSRTDYAALGQTLDGTLNWVAAGNTADAITATYVPAITTLVDGQECWFRALAANATATPTFAPNGLTARTITKNGGSALLAGDIAGNLAEVGLRYNLANTRWELINAKSVPTELVNAQTGTSYTVQTSDNAKLVTLTNASAIAVTLPQATGLFAAGWHADFTCLSSSVGSVTITPTTSTINGAATLVLVPGTGAKVASDGANYQILTYTIAPPRSYLAGLTTANNSTTKIDVAAGAAADSTNTVLMTTAGFTIDCGGTGANGLDTGALGVSLWYHVYLIAKTDGTTAGLASLQATTPSPMPSGYVYKRRIGSFKSNGSSQITTFSQVGDKFEWKAPVLDVNAVTPTSTQQNTITISAPPGVVTEAILSAQAGYASGAATALLIYPTSLTSAPAISAITSVVAGNVNSSSNLRITTNGGAPAQICTKLTYGGSTTYSIESLGWIDTRGRNS